jgi:glutathione peroxidase-family protein
LALAQLKPKNQRVLPQRFVWFSNQFLSQEPGSNKDIKEFARNKGFKGVLMDKIDVNGPEASPVYTFLKACFPAMALPSPFPAFCLHPCFSPSWVTGKSATE